MGKQGKKRRPYVMAMVLGTALSTFGSAQATTQVSGRTLDDMTRYCTACWRNARIDPDQWTDCTQDVFCRLLERLTTDQWSRILGSEGEERREFLRAIDAVKKKTQRSRAMVHGLTETWADHHDPEAQALSDERQAIREVAGRLSRRQQHILELSFDGWSVNEIGNKLEMPVERVSDEKYKAIRKLRTALGVSAR
jgi:RNA polymerase sigma factor (sigma-70 family)